MPSASPFRRFLDAQGHVVLDGGLATTLEAAGHVLDTKLWSAGLIRDAPGALKAVHRAFLEAGSDCISSASYQASLPGFAERGIGADEGAALLRRSVELAAEARDAFWADAAQRTKRLEPMVAASVGPYGAYLADGSEYDGSYGRERGGVGREALVEFHRPRLEILAGTAADVLAIETLPSLAEADVLAELLTATVHPGAWISFSCRDGARLWDGTPIEEAVRRCVPGSGIVAVGVNCTAPAHVTELVRRMRDATDLPILAYPNSGETYDARTGRWSGPAPVRDWLDRVAEWLGAGARIVGGCCRVGPDAIGGLRRRMREAIGAPAPADQQEEVPDAL